MTLKGDKPIFIFLFRELFYGVENDCVERKESES